MRPIRKTYPMNNRRYHLFLASLVAVWAGLGMSSCSKTTDQSAQSEKDSIARLLDAYVDAYKTGGYRNVRFAADVTFEGHLTNGRISGEAAVQKFLSNVSAKDVR